MAATGVLKILCDRVRTTANNNDLTDDQITEWVRYAEERFCNELRDISMKVSADCVADDFVIDIPLDWSETEWLRYVPGSTPPPNVNDVGSDLYALKTGKPLRPCTSDEFMSITGDPADPGYRAPLYMQHGRKIFLNPSQPALNGQKYNMGYFQMVPPLLEDETRLWARASNLYLTATLAYGAMYDVEDDRAATWDAVTGRTISTMNEYTQRAKMGNAPLRKRIRTFG